MRVRPTGATRIWYTTERGTGGAACLGGGQLVEAEQRECRVDSGGGGFFVLLSVGGRQESRIREDVGRHESGGVLDLDALLEVEDGVWVPDTPA